MLYILIILVKVTQRLGYILNYFQIFTVMSNSLIFLIRLFNKNVKSCEE